MSEILNIKKSLLRAAKADAADAPVLKEKADYYAGSEASPWRGLGYEGAERRSRETAAWTPSFRSQDQNINIIKPMADARSRDMINNDGYTSGAVGIHKDSIVGAQYRLNAKPAYKAIAGLRKGITADETWADEFQQAVEQRFGLLAESENCYFDASGYNTFTSLIRLAIGVYASTGEVLGTAEWLKDRKRPIKTAIQMVSPDRLSNPDNMMDTRTLRRGIEMDLRGKPTFYNIRKAYPTEMYFDDWAFTWDRVPAALPWGRKQVIHIIEQRLPGQSRGISEMVSALKQMRMTKHFQEITLQNAVINASYAAAIESELPPDAVFAAMGGPGTSGPGQNDWLGAIGGFMNALNEYMQAASNIKVDGAKIPHLFPGTKLSMKPMGTPGGVGTGFEASLLRYIAAALGVSYEEFSKDYSQTNYSSLRAGQASTWRFMQSRKKMVADRTANSIYTLYLEEDIANGSLPMPAGFRLDDFYQPLMREAFCKADWIGASRGQVDEMKETEAAILRIKGGLSSYEIECARLGSDFRDLFEQIAREQGIIKAKGLAFDTDISTRTLLSESPASGANNPNVKSDTTTGSQQDDTSNG